MWVGVRSLAPLVKARGFGMTPSMRVKGRRNDAAFFLVNFLRELPVYFRACVDSSQG